MRLSPPIARLLTRLRPLLPRLAARWQEHRAHRVIRRLQPALATGRAALLQFDASTSGEFTALAECLSTLDTRLATVSAQAAALDRILHGEDEDRAHLSAFDLYKKSVDLAHASIGIAISQEEEMAHMEGRLFENRGHFARNSFLFRVLVLNVRAESARIDPENRAIFATVAADMSEMNQQMSTTVETAFDELETIVKEAAAGRGQLQQLETDLLSSAQHSIKALRAELDGIQRSLAPCAEANARISTLLAESRRQSGGLIVALQYQDIVRQQLEHVAQGFEDIAGHVGTDRQAAPDVGYLRQAARVQQNHLGAARGSIESAGRQVGDASRGLLATGAALADEFNRMEAVAAGVFRDSKLAAMFRHETENLVQIASLSEITNERITRLLDRIGDNMRIFSTEIVRHEFEVQLVALNAQISAARLPEARALNKLAEETARLAGETADLTRTTTALLRDTLARLEVMRSESDKVRQILGHEKAELSRGALEVNAKLARLNERILQSSGETARSFSAAYTEAQSLLSGLHFPALIGASFDPAEELCTRLLAATAACDTHDLGTEGAERLAAHRSRYTMQQERAAHAAATAAAPAAPPAPGDAVELFGDAPPDGAPAAQPVAAGHVAPADEGIELF